MAAKKKPAPKSARKGATSRTRPELRAAKRPSAKKAATKKAASKKTATKKPSRPAAPGVLGPIQKAIAASLRDGTPKFWLVKSEPDVFSIDDLARDGETTWEGVRNYTARNFMRDGMSLGDLVLYYHSNAEPSGIVGVGRVSGMAEPDPFQFDPKSDYYDPESKKDDPRWLMVRVAFEKKLPRTVTLDELKADPSLSGMLVIQKGQRLSVQPVEKAHFERVLAIAR
jgi:predicted RNA-binding protein with PUA-like domain